MQKYQLPAFRQGQPVQVPLSDQGLTYKARGCAPHDTCLGSKHVQPLLSSLVGAWLLGCEPRSHIFQHAVTALSQWNKAMIEKFSEEYLARLTPEQNNVLYYNLALGLFDHVKVEIENSGVSGAIENLYVRGRLLLSPQVFL
jgi:hypothetical protein